MTERESTVQDIRFLLERRASPRMHMLALVAATAAVGLVSSFLLLENGITAMVIRYPLAVLIAYAAFLCLVSVWLRCFGLRTRRHRDPSSGEWGFDLIDLPTHTAASRVAMASGGGSGGWDLDLGGDGIWLVVVAAIAIIAFSILVYVVYIAPALFAELLLDAGLAAGLYRRLASLERRSWLATALRRTAIPAASIAVLLGIGGHIMQAVYPDAVSIGRVVDHVRASAPRQSGNH